MKAMIVIQHGRFTIDMLHRLESMLHKHYLHHIDEEKLVIMWNIIPKGHAITDRKPSQSTLISIQVPNDTPKSIREALIEACYFNWQEITQQGVDHIMVSAPDKDVFNQMVFANLQRFSTIGKARFLANMARQFIKSKYQHNLLITSL